MMSQNKMAELAEILHLSVGEKFVIKGYTGFFKLESNGLTHISHVDGRESAADNFLLKELITGARSYRRCFKPQKGEAYYHPASDFNGTVKAVWQDTCFDLAYYKCGLVFKTSIECIEAMNDLKKELYSEYEKD